MKVLHTSDWHVGKTIRGRSRTDEHRAVLAEIVEAAVTHECDVVLVAGDLFETAAPTAEAEEIVYRALLDLAATGAHVAVISGNHDNARRLKAIQPLLHAAGSIHLVAEPTRAADGGVRMIDTAAGESLRLAMLPFLSQRGIVRARDLMDATAFEQVQAYTDRLRLLIESLTTSFADDAVNVFMTHAFVVGGKFGGGERMAHFIDDYAVSAQILPATASYVALGHIHRPQKIAGPGAIHYCGSPLQLDFGESEQPKQVNIIELEAGLPAAVTPVALTAGRTLRTLIGSLDELAESAKVLDLEASWLQVRVTETASAGLADRVRSLLGEQVVDVRIEAPEAKKKQRRQRREGRSPSQLFGDFLTEQQVEDSRVSALFDELLDDAQQVDG